MTKTIERVQTGVRLEKRLLKVLKGLAEHLDISLGDLIEGLALHAFENKPPFSEATLGKIAMEQMTETKNYPDLTDRFEAGTLAPEGFSHVDHIGVACQMLQRYEFLDAAQRYGRALRDIAARAGAPDKFNVTITLAFLGLLSERMVETVHETFAEFLEKNPDLTSRSLMATWYSDSRIASGAARQSFLMPDRTVPLCEKVGMVRLMDETGFPDESGAEAPGLTSGGGAAAPTPDDGAYRVLARKYRPKTFEDLVGQEPMVQTLENAFDTGRIAQAWMLTGVRGVGKTTTARILARGLNYEVPGGADKPTVKLTQEGTHCKAIMEGRHVDVIEMDAASHTGINDIREIIDAARYRPATARYKVYIIDEVHMLSNAAFNGLL
ncbi:dnaX, partial [Symbiodinium microadriaticum]